VAGVDPVRNVTSRAWQAVVRLDVTAGGPPTAAETVQAAVELDDGAGRSESFGGLALGGVHPQRLAAVLCEQSELVYPDASWAYADLVPVDSALPPLSAALFTGGADAYGDLVPDDFFDPAWVPGDEGPAAGVHALAQLDDVSSLMAPDLYEPSPLPELDSILDPPSLAGPIFEPCLDPEEGPPQATQPPELLGLLLDPTDAAELARIVDYQQQLVTLADELASFVVLLDVPPGLDQRGIVAWRTNFASAFAAAYHPWLDVARPADGRNATVRLNPAAFAAGIIAEREWAYGVPFGPSNEIAVGAVDVADDVSPARHDELHPLGINVFLRRRDGIELTAARTLSLDPAYRQLSVRRLITMLIRTLSREMQWVVFEPNDESLLADLRHLLRGYLTRLYRANAFAGATEDEAFFVRCDATLNTQSVLDAGQLIAQIGVAPADPLEFIVVQLTHDGDGTLVVQGAATR
jgi:Bacteriophage tail sheath protein